MKILIAPDKFKSSLSANKFCEIVSSVLSQLPDVEIWSQPMSDGGEGTLAIIRSHLTCQVKMLKSPNAAGALIDTSYLLSGQTAIIELAQASGRVGLSPEQRNPMYTSTYGTGVQIKDAINKGAEEIMLFVGGSATNDAGMGIAAALGFQFLDQSGEVLQPIGANLGRVADIKSPDNWIALKRIKFTVVCDVSNPMYGDHGAAKVYALQKGANHNEVDLLDQGLRHFAELIQQKYQIDLQEIPGTGAAGAVACSMLALLDANIQNGIDTIIKMIDLEEKITDIDLVISGEGCLDEQTHNGKVIDGIGKLCKQYDKPFIAIVGTNKLDITQYQNLGLSNVYSLLDLADSLDDAIARSEYLLVLIAEKIRKSLT